jgi:glycosyltransferase involved in cell wall biosynthesis
MRILLIHQLFNTPEEGGGIRSYIVAKTLAEAGHEVVVISTHNEKSGRQSSEGFDIHYLGIPYDNSFGFLKRLWAYGQFVLKARKLCMSIPNVDLAYILTTPLTTGFIATYLKQRGIPYVFDVGDLWPDAPIQLGWIKNSMLKRWLYKKEKEFYDSAECIIALSPDIANAIKVKTSTDVHTVTNMADLEFFRPSFRMDAVTVDHPFRVLYCGAHGRANHLEFLLDAARACQQRNLPVLFKLMGKGSERERLIGLSHDLGNVMFLPHGSKEDVQSELEYTDAVYVSFADVPILGTGSPNKFFDALAAGKITIINFGGWLQDVIEMNVCGFSYKASNPGEFVHKIQPLLNIQNLRKAQLQARDAANEYSVERQMELLLSIVNSIKH